MHQPSSVFITTLPLSRLDEYLECLSTWTQHYHLFVLVSTSDANENPLELDKLNGLHIKPLVYDFDLNSSGGRRCLSMRTPSLALLWDALELISSDGQVAVYINADIELRKGEHEKLDVLIHHCQQNKNIAFLRRWDYSWDSESPSIPYLVGFDAFILPRDILDHCDRKSLQNLFIGQVGWDYALPLLFGFQQVLTSLSVHLTHKIHPTSSTSPWEDAMIFVHQNTDASHIRRLSIYRIAVARILSGLDKIFERVGWGIFYRNSVIKSIYKYAYARMLYYLLIKKLLLNLREF